MTAPNGTSTMSISETPATCGPGRRPRSSGLRGRIGAVFAVAAVVVSVAAVSATPVAADSESYSSEIIVRLAPGVDAVAFAAAHQVRLAEPLVPGRDLWVFEPLQLPQRPKEQAKAAEETAKELAKLPSVVWAEQNYDDGELEDDRFHAWPEGLPTDVGDEAEAWTEQHNLASLQLDAVHRKATGDGVVVAILDTGADLGHRHLAPHLTHWSTHYDYVDDDPWPMESADGNDNDGDGLVDEAFGHGTHTAGLVALVAPEAKIMIYRVLDDDGHGDPYVVAAAIDDAVANGADVINLSFGMTGKPKSKVLREAFKNAEKNDVVIVAAVGNDGDDATRFPSEDKTTIGVAATAGDTELLAPFSNYGKQALVAAPGEDIVSTLPGDGFGAWSGTSMATPIVSGQVALIVGMEPNREAKKFVERVGKSSRKMQGKNRAEKGIIDILSSLED